MEFIQKYYNYSVKNISIPWENLYKITLLKKVELLVKRMRRKVHLFENNIIRQHNPLNYTFKSRKIPPQHKGLIVFENDLVKLIQNVTFRHISNNFQDQMKTDIESIKRSKNIYTFGDKTNNL